MARTILHVDMDSFFASVEQQANPKLRGIPIAVSGDPKSRTVIAAASKEAKKFGVKSAMTIREARALCPQIQFVLGDPDKYVEVSRRVIRILEDFTPDVEIASIDEAFFDVTGWAEHALAGPAAAATTPAARCPLRARSLRAQGDPPSASPARAAIHIAQEIKRRIRAELGEWITCSIGIAPNKRLAKLASDFNKPDGLVVVYDDAIGPPHTMYFLSERSESKGALRQAQGIQHAHSVPQFQLPTFISRSDLLSQLHLRDLCGIGARIEARLERLGITTVGGLAAAPLDLLVEEFGSYGYELHDMAMGHDEAPVQAGDTEPKSMGHAATLPKDLKTLDEVRPVVEELSEKVAARLRRHGYRGFTIHAVLRFRDFTSRSEQITIPDATDDGLRISKEVMRMVGAWTPRLPVRLIGVSVGKLIRSTPLQAPLFPKDQRWRSATAALDAANDRYGDWTVRRGSLMRGERVLRRVAAAFQSTRHLRDA